MCFASQVNAPEEGQNQMIVVIDKLLLDCWLDASEAQVAVVLRVLSAVCLSCAASALAVRLSRRVCCQVAGGLRLWLPAASSLSSSEKLYQESGKSLLGLSAPVHPFSCLQLCKQIDSADDGPNGFRPLQLSWGKQRTPLALLLSSLEIRSLLSHTPLRLSSLTKCNRIAARQWWWETGHHRVQEVVHTCQTDWSKTGRLLWKPISCISQKCVRIPFTIQVVP